MRMRLDEGLTGLVGEQLAPVMVADAFHHPRFKYFPEAGEDPYHSFLGVPLVEGGTLQGVLVVQTVEPRTFSPSEVRMLVTVAAQLAPLVGDARLLERVCRAWPHQPERRRARRGWCRRCTGTPLSPGLGLGQAYVVDGFDEWRRTVRAARQRRRPRAPAGWLGAVEARPRGDHPAEPAHLRAGRRGPRGDPPGAADDHAGPHHRARPGASLDRRRQRRGGAVRRRSTSTSPPSSDVSTPFFQERVYDIKDVFHRLLWQLRPRPAAATTSCATRWSWSRARRR